MYVSMYKCDPITGIAATLLCVQRMHKVIVLKGAFNELVVAIK